MVTQLPLRKLVRRTACRTATRHRAWHISGWHITRWHIAVFVATLGLVLRALVPTGFMPDARALQAGHIELTLCSPASAGALRHVTIQLSADDTSTSPGSGTSSSANASRQSDIRSSPFDSLGSPSDCPFGSMTAQAVIVPSPIAIAGVGSAALTGSRIARDLATILPVQGPPLGARAPPALA